MKAILCLLLGLGCLDRALPYPTHAPAVAHPAVEVPHVELSPLALPASDTSFAFSPGCNLQPPAHLRQFFVAAARRFPAGATDCELARQSWVESRWIPDAVSPAGAAGIAQFMPGTARELGLDPFNPREAIFGQARYLQWCREAWDPYARGRVHADIKGLGLGCYNWGRGSMFADQRRNGWTLYPEAKPHLPEETRHYVEQIEGF